MIFWFRQVGYFKHFRGLGGPTLPIRRHLVYRCSCQQSIGVISPIIGVFVFRPGHFVGCVMVWAAGVKVAGSVPTGGILAKMCECACTAVTHSLAQNLPSVGLEPGSIALQSGRLPFWKTSQLGHPRLPPYHPGNNGPCIIKYSCPLSGL